MEQRNTETLFHILAFAVIHNKNVKINTLIHKKKIVNFATLNKIILDYRRCKSLFKNKIVDVINGKVNINSFANLISKTKKSNFYRNITITLL